MRFTIALLAPSLMLSACGVGAESNSEPVDVSAEQSILADSIDFADKDCATQGLPIAIVLKNNSAQPTRSVSWHFAVSRVNHSDNLTTLDMATPFNDPSRRTDRIIQPGESYKVCSSAPVIEGYDLASNELEYSVIVNDGNYGADITTVD